MPLVEARWLGSAGAVGAVSIAPCGRGASEGSLFCTPVADGNGQLLLIVWEKDGDKVNRRGDSGQLDPPVPVDLVACCSSPDDDGLAVTAVRESGSRHLRLMFWSLGADRGGKLHPVVAYEAHNAGAGHVVQHIALSRCAAGVATAVVRGDHRLSLTIWDYVAFSPGGKPALGPHRIGHSDTSIEATALAVAEWAGGVVTATCDRASGNLQLIAWTIGTDGAIAMKGTATGDAADDVAMTAVSDSRLVTVVKSSNGGELQANVWDISPDGTTITSRGSIVAPPPAAIHDGLSICSLSADILVDLVIAPAQVAAASREANGRLKITLWDIDDGGAFHLTADQAFDPVDGIAITFAGTGTEQTTGGHQTPKSQALVAARRANGNLGLFALAAANDDVIPDIPGWASIEFDMQHQQQSRWCWAANSTSVAHFYKPSTSWTQCKVANHVKGRTDCCGSGASGPCNNDDSLETALNVVQHLNRVIGAPVPYDDVQAQIAGGFPVGVRTAWSGGGAHFIAIVGYERAEERLLTVADPISGVSVYNYDTFKTAYRHTGTWTHTYYTQP